MSKRLFSNLSKLSYAHWVLVSLSTCVHSKSNALPISMAGDEVESGDLSGKHCRRQMKRKGPPRLFDLMLVTQRSNTHAHTLCPFRMLLIKTWTGRAGSDCRFLLLLTMTRAQRNFIICFSAGGTCDCFPLSVRKVTKSFSLRGWECQTFTAQTN